MENLDRERLRQALEVVAAAGRAAVAMDLSEALDVLDRAAGLPDLDPQLRHYLVKRSYGKALLLLEGGQPPHGICGGKFR